MRLSESALIVVDVQRGFDHPKWGRRDRPECEANVAQLVAAFRRVHRPIVYVRHDSIEPDSPLRPGEPGNALREFLREGPDLLVRKSVHSAFYGTPDLHAWLQSNRIRTTVICGVTTNHCCETTARMAGNLGYHVYFVLDATHTFDRHGPDGVIVPAETLALVTAANLHEEFATVTSTSKLLAALDAVGGRS
jgi:nicotinamidase-related amidase